MDSSLECISTISTVQHKAQSVLWYAKFESIWSVLDDSLAIQLALLRCLSSAAEPAPFFPDDTPTLTSRATSRDLPLLCPAIYLQLASLLSCCDGECVVMFVLFQNYAALLSELLVYCVLDFCEVPVWEPLPEYLCEYPEFLYVSVLLPITVAARSETWTVFSRSNTRIMGSNPTQGMDVCLLLFSVCVVKAWMLSAFIQCLCCRV
jgi:hypothetical protein